MNSAIVLQYEHKTITDNHTTDIIVVKFCSYKAILDVSRNRFVSFFTRQSQSVHIQLVSISFTIVA